MLLTTDRILLAKTEEQLVQLLTFPLCEPVPEHQESENTKCMETSVAFRSVLCGDSCPSGIIPTLPPETHPLKKLPVL